MNRIQHTLQRGQLTGVRAFITSYLLLCMCFLPSFSPDKNDEYKLKAAFMYNFTQYFEWEDQTGDVIVAVLGPSPILTHLNQIARTKSGGKKRIVVKQYQTLKEIGACNFLFIPHDSGIPLEEILSKIPKGTLTVTERRGAGTKGAALNFIVVKNKLKFESNLKTINAAGVKASSELLKLAIIIE